MKHKIKRHALLLASMSVLAAGSASAANSFYAPGDLVLYFQQEGGTNTVYVSLGNAANLYRGVATGTAADGGLSQLNIVNINPTLVAAFGANWATSSTVYAGLAGVYGASPSSTILNNSEPERTLYLSSSRDNVGTIGIAESIGFDLSLAGNTAMTGASNGIITQNNVFEVNYDAQQTVSLAGLSQIDNQNPFSSPGIQGNAFQGNIEGGVQQQGATGTFGDFGFGSTEFALDLFRVQATNNIAGQIGFGDANRLGTFEGTVTVGTDGGVSFLVPEPSSTALVGIAAGAMLLRRRRRN